MHTYIATNTLNGKFYIGSTSNFDRRKKEHLEAGDPYPFQRALRKNPDAFEWEVIADESDEPILEQALLDMWFGKECCYNLNPSAKHPPRNVEAFRRGGLTMGFRHKADGTGVFARTPEQKMADGKKGGQTSVSRKVGAHGRTPEQIKEDARKGGESNVLNKTGFFNPDYTESEKYLEDKKKASKVAHSEKDERGRSMNAVKMITAIHAEKDELGRSKHAVKLAANMNAQRWEDPDHPELGQRSAGVLTIMQRRRGYPSGKENRKRVK
jgi:hypothetical protein